ncbi:MAG: iron-containing alcohol dehydrogenase [Actinobacteria bacterium]|nr:iron-containing alcohol dehydrogenase [Actinomycetota bacterium]
MENFNFYSPTRIIFGRDSEECLGREIKKYGKKVLLHYGGGSIKRSGLYDKVIKYLKSENIDFTELNGVKPNPRLGLVRDGIGICRKQNIDFILAVGGGSVIDSAKAIAAGSPYKGDVWDFFSSAEEIQGAIPLGVVLTISAAGSEVSADMVITNEDGWYKRAAHSDFLRSKFSILDPEITFTLSAEKTVIGVSDIMAHIYERYFTQVKNTELTDRLAEATLMTVINNARLVLGDLTDYDPRAEIMWAGSIAHNNLLEAGKISDWASHMIEHELSAIYDIPHGEGLAIIFPAWMKYVYKDNILKFAQFAERVWSVDTDLDDLEGTALEGITRVEAYYREIGLPVRLNEIEIGEDRFEEMAAKCTQDGPVGKFRELKKDDIIKIYRLAK